MDSNKLFQIKIDSLEKKVIELEKELEKQELIKLSYKEEVAKWNKKYKDLRKQITG